MNALRRQNSGSQLTFERLTLYEGRIALLSEGLMDAEDTRLESPRELARQSEAKRKQAPQSEANVFRHKCNLKKPRL